MNRYQSLFIGVLLGFTSILFAQGDVAISSPSVQPSVSTNTASPSISPFPFSPGEKFVFDIKYQFISGGEATLELTEGEPINGRPIYQITSWAKSNGFVDVFFRVRDFNASFVDAETLASYSFIQNLREGKYKVYREYTINYSSGTFRYKRQYKGKITTRDGTIDEEVSDILSSFYKARTLPLELGKDFFIRVFSDKKIYSLKVEVDDKLHNVKVPAGKFECFRLRPFVVGDNIFKGKKKGRMHLWITNDERRMPVLIRSKVAIGAFNAELIEFTRPE